MPQWRSRGSGRSSARPPGPTPPGPAGPALGTRDPQFVTRCIARCDADRFFFAVVALERPGLAREARPVVVGHDPRRAPRAIVTTANDAAHARGVGSGMSAARALHLAPDALFVPPHHDLLPRVFRLPAGRPGRGQPDRPAALDRRGLAGVGPQRLRPGRGPRPARAVLTQAGLSISVGVAASKLVAKMATGAAKPGGVRVVRPGQEPAFLARQPVRALFGVGPRTAERLGETGVTTIRELAARPRAELVRLFGRAHGTHLWERARGIDRTELEPDRAPQSYSAEHTFQQDTVDRRQLWDELRAQAEEVAGRLRSDGLLAAEVAIKLRYANFETLTRQLFLPIPTADAEALADAAARLMRRHWDRARPVRLIGLRAARFRPADAPSQLPLTSDEG
jgi:DNA polymerase IV